ncbi:MAG TPA: NAD-dependent epimerase/dehydratase family protein [Phycisphaerae bacterium]|mgnify:CR=1 FL=1|nr:NAD-dependent epimerase/dehydratase family protein [Phycisphaerae bacterium]
MRILLVGGSGHVSGAVARAAVTAGHEVWAITRGQRPLPDGVRPLLAERHDDGMMTAALNAAGGHWDLAVDCIGYTANDVRQDIRLLRDRAARFVFVSTDFVYNPAHRRFPQPEDADGYETEQAYGRNKREGEQALIEGDACEMAWTILRPCHIYGPTSELGCLPLHGRDPHLIARLRAGEALRLVGGGYFLQQPIFADDLAQTILSAGYSSRAARAIVNVAGPDIIESRQYYQIIADVLGVPLTVEELLVDAYLREHPEAAPFLCHRIYDLRTLLECGLAVPATPITEGLRLHVEGLLQR